MKYILIALLLVVIITIGGRLIFKDKASIAPVQQRSTTKPTAHPSLGTLVEYDNTSYMVYLQKVDTPENLKLIPNFKEKKSSSTLIAENNCRYGINGGFYTSNNQPLGLFYTQGTLINGKVHNNNLFNGYLIQNSVGLFDIVSEPPHFRPLSLDFYFQSGPRFTPATTLRIKDDERARRMLVGKTDTSEWYFFAIVEKDNINSGPLLSELPGLIHSLNNEFLTLDASRFTLLLNLDGGSASAFYNKEGVSLGELIAIGSFLCGVEKTVDNKTVGDSLKTDD